MRNRALRVLTLLFPVLAHISFNAMLGSGKENTPMKEELECPCISVYVLGEGLQAGSFPMRFQAGMTVRDSIAQIENMVGPIRGIRRVDISRKREGNIRDTVEMQWVGSPGEQSHPARLQLEPGDIVDVVLESVNLRSRKESVVYVSGYVNRPDVLRHRTRMTVGEALEGAGGVQNWAATGAIILFPGRGGDAAQVQAMPVSAETLAHVLPPYSAVVVVMKEQFERQALHYYFSGEVKRPGVWQIREGDDVLAAAFRAGLRTTGDKFHVWLLRKVEGGWRLGKVALLEVMVGGGEKTTLQAGDILHVGPGSDTSWKEALQESFETKTNAGNGVNLEH